MKYFSLIVVLVLLAANTAFSQSKNDTLHKSINDSSYSKMRDSLMNVYTKQSKEYEKMKKEKESNQRGFGSSLFGLNIDVIFGVGFSNTNFELNNDSAGLSNTASKTGPVLGVNINLNLLGIALGTGFSYSSKGYTSNNSSYSANYFNIPLLFAFNFSISKVDIDLAAGPYLGILLSQDKNQNFALKNIDLGITGRVQGTYFFNRFMGTLLGVKYEQGGLNNLLQSTGAAGSNYVNSIKTTNWFIYTGLKFVL